VNDANQFYQKAYLFYSDKDLQRTSIAVGVMAEAYINFGWFGIVFIMLFVGIVLGLYERLFVSSHSNTLLLAIGTSMLPQFLVIEAQLAQYLSGIIQQVIFSFLVFLPITRRPSKLPLPQPQSMERVPIRLKPVAR
jgi:hypothetical protein